jgi:geranylgeranyl diphosphate synthase type I
MTAPITINHCPSPRWPPAPRELRERVDDALTQFLHREADRFTTPSPLHQVFDLLRRFVLGGGKRIRPLFCYWGWRSAGGPDCAEIIHAAASLELFQAFALMHDDVMDGSQLRRGEPALHRALTGLHVRQRWRGQQDHFGVCVAILCGDLCLSYSDEMLHDCGLPTNRVRVAQQLAHEMRSEVMIGQTLDLLDQAAGGSLEGALTIIRLKSAKYTIERPLQIGAILAGARPELLKAYSEFAIPLGEAFQLRDDVLGVFGDSTVTGKPTIDDLREGKPTVLVALARQGTNDEQAAQIQELHGNPLLEEKGAATLRQIITTTGALDRVEHMIHERHVQALAALDQIQIPSHAKEALLELATATIARTS